MPSRAKCLSAYSDMCRSNAPKMWSFVSISLTWTSFCEAKVGGGCFACWSLPCSLQSVHHVKQPQRLTRSSSAAGDHLEFGKQAQQIVHDQVVYLGCRFHACWPAANLQVGLAEYRPATRPTVSWLWAYCLMQPSCQLAPHKR